MQRKPSKKDKILNTTLKIIAKKGNLNFTIREVILDADVNIASVNYYFGTKRKLVEEIEKKIIVTLIEFQKTLFNYLIPPKQRFIQWANTLVDFLLESPGIILILSNKLISTEKFEGNIESFIQDNNKHLAAIIKEITGIEEEEEIRLKVMQINASLFYPLLFIDNSTGMFGISIQDPIIRKKYVKLTLNTIL